MPSSPRSTRRDGGSEGSRRRTGGRDRRARVEPDRRAGGPRRVHGRRRARRRHRVDPEQEGPATTWRWSPGRDPGRRCPGEPPPREGRRRPDRAPGEEERASPRPRPRSWFPSRSWSRPGDPGDRALSVGATQRAATRRAPTPSPPSRRRDAPHLGSGRTGPATATDRHDHAFHKVLFCLSGSIVFHTDGRGHRARRQAIGSTWSRARRTARRSARRGARAWRRLAERDSAVVEAAAGLLPELALRDQVPEERRRLVFDSPGKASRRTSPIASSVSSPIRSDRASGPIGCASPRCIAVSMSSRDANPDSYSRIASNRYGISRRFTMNPASSPDRTQVLPRTSVPNARTSS